MGEVIGCALFQYETFLRQKEEYLARRLNAKDKLEVMVVSEKDSKDTKDITKLAKTTPKPSTSYARKQSSVMSMRSSKPA
jgi:hypothetical protein